MVKSYLKFERSKTFGVVCSASANIVWTPDPGSTSVRNTAAGRAYVPANEEVLCWDVKKGDLVSRWREDGNKAEVTAIARSKAEDDVFAVGYADGSIRLWDSRISSVVVSFNGHKSAVTALTFDKAGVRLVSGSRDTDIIVWDLVAETGLFKLRGHKDQVTALEFVNVSHESDGEQPRVENYLVTAGKDALIKLWDLGAQHCVETHIAQSNGECWSMAMSPDGNGFITGGNDGELKVWAVDAAALESATTNIAESGTKCLIERGTLFRQGKDRTLTAKFHPRGEYIAIHGPEKAVEILRVRSESEVLKHMARKRRRRKEKAAQKQEDAEMDQDTDIHKADISDVIVQHVIVRTSGKVRSIDWSSLRPDKNIQLVVETVNNQIEVYNVQTHSKSKEAVDYTRAFGVDLPGHRADIRSVTLSSDDSMLASSCNGSLKVWNIRTQNCIRTFECGYALCCAFLPGDKIIVMGTKSGELELFDVASSAQIDSIKAHEGSIWSLDVHPDGKSLITGSADKTVKFWRFDIVQEEIPGTKRTTPRLKLVHTRTLKLTDDVLAVRFSPDSRLVAAALLDSTVKIFFVDSLKLYLNLYGHKLPVLSMDISQDSKLIVTCSADKNVRLWGLDFGDCHKAFFAHQDSIMQVAFLPIQDGGHNFFSTSKDRLIKYWDGDKFEQIQKLEGHHGEIWALAVSRTGEFIVTASHDRSIRVWEQTEEQIFLEEEREREMEELYETTLTTTLGREEDIHDNDRPEAVDAGKQTVETLMAGERIMEALDIGLEDLEVMREYREAKITNPKLPMPQRNIILMALNVSAETHVLNVVSKVKAASLQDTLLVLPFDKVIALFRFLDLWAQQHRSISLTCRILFFLLQTHHKQIVASKQSKVLLDGIRAHLRSALDQQKKQMGFNLAALRFISDSVQENSKSDFVDENWEDNTQSQKKRAFLQVS